MGNWWHQVLPVWRNTDLADRRHGRAVPTAMLAALVLVLLPSGHSAQASEATSRRAGGHGVAASPVLVSSNQLVFRGHASTVAAEQGSTTVRLNRSLPGHVLLGDWNGNGIATPGSFHQGTWRLHNQLDASDPPTTFNYGRTGDTPLVGDWNGDGRDTVGIRRGDRFHLTDNNRTATYEFSFGASTDTPLTGDFNGNGHDTVGVRRGATFYLSNRARGGAADVTVTFGRSTDQPLIGDWNGDGRDTIGVRRGVRYYLSDNNRTSIHEFSFGTADADVRIWSGAQAGGPCPTAAITTDSPHVGLRDQVRAPDVGSPVDGNADLDAALHTAARYLLGTQYPQIWADHPHTDGYYDVLGTYLGRTEHGIRPPAMAAASLAIALRTGYDETGAGHSAADATEHVRTLVRSLACQHSSITMGGWGDQWQSAYWAQFVGLAAWLIWDELSPEERFYVARMVEHEADRFINQPVPYWRDRTGHGPVNTYAEEVAWNASHLSLASAMMPNHPRRGAWMGEAVLRGVAGAAMPHDLTNDDVLNGRPVRGWLGGYNVMPDGLVYNHNRISPDYSTAMHAAWTGALFHSLAGQATPRALLHNGDRIYGALSTRAFPGGTVYTPDSHEIRYPEGSSWSDIQQAQFANFDTMAAVLGLDGLSTVGGLDWQRLHLQGQLALQARFADGRTYSGWAEHRYPGREELTAHLLAYARLTEHIGQLGTFTLDDGDYAKDGSPSPPPSASPPKPPPPSFLDVAVPLAIDVDADGRSDLGWWYRGAWAITTNSGHTYRFNYGRATDEPLVGDWNGDGRETVGVRRGKTFYLSNAVRGGEADYSFMYGREGDEVLIGDWNGDGRDTIALRRGATFYVSNAPRGGEADETFTYGRVNDQALVGDWNGNGKTTVGIKRDREYHLVNRLRGGVADYNYVYGWTTDTPLVGDFNGNGQDTVTIVRDGVFHVNDHPRGGTATRVVTPPRP